MGNNLLASDNTPITPMAWQMRAAVSGGAAPLLIRDNR